MGFIIKRIEVKLGASLGLQKHLVMIEVQSGGCLGENDIAQFEDNYGRALRR